MLNYCAAHTAKMNLLHRVCFDTLCRGEGLLCSLCEKERHDGHDTYELGELQRMVDDDRNNQHSLNSSLNVVRQLKETRARLAGNLGDARKKINALLDQADKATEQYFERVEELVGEQQDRIRRATPRDSSVDTGAELDILNRRVVALVSCHLDWKAVAPDAENVMRWLLKSATENAANITAPLARLTQEF